LILSHARQLRFTSLTPSGIRRIELEAFVKRRHLDYVQNAFTALLKAIDSQLEQNLPKGQ
jgi:hypothetical protein